MIIIPLYSWRLACLHNIVQAYHVETRTDFHLSNDIQIHKCWAPNKCQIFFKHLLTSVVHNCDLMFGKCMWHSPQQSVAFIRCYLLHSSLQHIKSWRENIYVLWHEDQQARSCHCCFNDCLPPSLHLDTFCYQLAFAVHLKHSVGFTFLSKTVTQIQIVGTDLVVVCPIWNCSCSDTCTPHWILMSVGIVMESKMRKVHDYKLIEVGIIDCLLLLVLQPQKVWSLDCTTIYSPYLSWIWQPWWNSLYMANPNPNPAHCDPPQVQSWHGWLIWPH